jgi:hypothetical protein
MSIKDPKGFFKPGRIFRTRENGSELPLVAVGGDLKSSIACVSVSQGGEGEVFPVIQENPTASVGSSVQLDFEDQHTVSPTYDVMNIGRIDRKCLRKLKSRYEQTRCAEVKRAREDDIATKDIPMPAEEIISPGQHKYPTAWSSWEWNATWQQNYRYRKTGARGKRQSYSIRILMPGI